MIRRRKIYPAKLKSYLPDMQFVRNKADYAGDSINKKIAERWLFRAKEMVELTEKEIKQ